MIAGIKLTMGGTEYEVPPLNFRALETLQPSIQQMGALNGFISKEQMAVIADVVLAALQRNYPEMTRERVMDMLDLGNMAAVFKAIMGASGFEATKPGERQPGS